MKTIHKIIAIKGYRGVFGSFVANKMIGKPVSLRFAKKPRFKWHTPNSVSFRLEAILWLRLNSRTRGKVRQLFKVRLYRKNTKASWTQRCRSGRGSCIFSRPTASEDVLAKRPL